MTFPISILLPPLIPARVNAYEGPRPEPLRSRYQPPTPSELPPLTIKDAASLKRYLGNLEETINAMSISPEDI